MQTGIVFLVARRVVFLLGCVRFFLHTAQDRWPVCVRVRVYFCGGGSDTGAVSVDMPAKCMIICDSRNLADHHASLSSRERRNGAVPLAAVVV